MLMLQKEGFSPVSQARHSHTAHPSLSAKGVLVAVRSEEIQLPPIKKLVKTLKPTKLLLDHQAFSLLHSPITLPLPAGMLEMGLYM